LWGELASLYDCKIEDRGEPRGQGKRRQDGVTAAATRGKIEMEDREIRAALDRHWAASDANDFEAEHRIYREDAVLEYPQSGERIRGRRNIQASRFAQPSKKRFTVRRILGSADLWVTEFVLTYDGQPSYTVSIMEFKDGKVSRETQYFGDAFEPGPSRAQWVERMR
jgi:ketosteroid isomerase-like protein